MQKTPKYFIVEAKALPEIFQKVVETKRLLETGEAQTVNEATAITDISRSAFYKYKDSVSVLQDMLNGRIVTFQIMLKNEPGILSAVLAIFARSGANILTINQGIPVSGCAAVTVSAETSGMQVSLEEFLERVGNIMGVIRCETLAG